ncbi:MAG: LysR family transcriptional regulator [Proteobacteria bacterium]|nr:LysR family transcriptional regulator [Pseudomonadota bacterium]
MFTLVQLRCFVTLAEELNFRRAARRLNMSQPPLSRHIQALEHEIGAELVARNRRSVELTAAGASFARLSQRILDQAIDAYRQTRQIASGDAGEITISFTALSSYAFVPSLVALLRKHYPSIALTLREMTTPQQLAALASRQVDICLLRPPVALPNIRTTRVLRERLLAAVPAKHPLAKRRQINIREFDGSVLVTYPPVEGPYFHGMVTGLFQAAGVYPSAIQYITQTHAILGCVAVGVGLAVVPESAKGCAPAGAVLRPLIGAEGVHVDLVMASPVETTNPASASVLALVEKHLGSRGRATAAA